MSRSHLILSATVAAMAAAICSASAETAATSEPVGSYHLKRKSTFTAAENSRAPFWPIGHVKRAKTVSADTGMAEPVVERSKLQAEMFNVTSIVLGNPSLAIINGRAYGEGENIRFPKSAAPATKGAGGLDPRVRIRVTRILDGSVTLQSPDGQIVTAPLKRPELQQRATTPDEELLDPDR
jgi:hypothetical protein